MTTKPRRVFRLSEHEVRVLQALFNHVGGNPDSTSRGAVDAMFGRLMRTFGLRGRIATEGSVYFIDILSETLHGR